LPRRLDLLAVWNTVRILPIVWQLHSPNGADELHIGRLLTYCYSAPKIRDALPVGFVQPTRHFAALSQVHLAGSNVRQNIADPTP
jgi:hypothetical protein